MAVASLAVLISAAYELTGYWCLPGEMRCSAPDAFVAAVAPAPHSLFLPLLACVPFAAAVADDVRTGLVSHFVLRVGRCRYLASRLVTNGVAAITAVMLPQVFIVFLLGVRFGFGGTIGTLVTGPGREWAAGYPWRYLVMLLVFAGLSAVLWATLGLVLGMATGNPYVALAGPQGLAMAVDYVLHLSNVPQWTTSVLILPYAYERVSWINILGIYSAWYFVIVFVFLFRRRVEWLVLARSEG